MKLDKQPKRKDSKSKSKRVGRGYGSGKGGHTSGLGTKGQKARGKSKIPTGFEGGQVPLYKKIPKLSHFQNRPRKNKTIVSLIKFNRFKDGDKVTPELLFKKKIIKEPSRYGVKIIANGDLHKKLELEGFEVSAGAREKIKKSGSQIIEN